MSLISSIKTKRLEDFMNGGSKMVLTGTVSGVVADSAILALPHERIMFVSSYVLTSNNATPILVSLGFKAGAGATLEFFRGYVSSTASVSVVLDPHDWVYGPLSTTTTQVSLVITTSAGNVVYTIGGKVFAEKNPLGYIEQIGAQTHANPYFNVESGYYRAQSEF